MQTFAQYALPGTIVASAVGAVVLCLVLLLYGFKSEPDDERSPAPRLLLIRLGHAVAAACFAAALMLSAVALMDQRQMTVLEPADVQRLKAQVRTLERRLAATESRLQDVRSPAVVAPAVVPDAPRSSPSAAPRAKSAPPRRAPVPQTAVSPGERGAPLTMGEPGEAATIQPASSGQRPLPTATAASSRDDLGVKMREDWDSVGRGFREAGRDLRSGFADLGRKIKRTFE